MPVAASAVYFLNLRGDVLINRLYRDDVGGVLSGIIYMWVANFNHGYVSAKNIYVVGETDSEIAKLGQMRSVDLGNVGENEEARKNLNITAFFNMICTFPYPQDTQNPNCLIYLDELFYFLLILDDVPNTPNIEWKQYNILNSPNRPLWMDYIGERRIFWHESYTKVNRLKEVKLKLYQKLEKMMKKRLSHYSIDGIDWISNVTYSGHPASIHCLMYYTVGGTPVNYNLNNPFSFLKFARHFGEHANNVGDQGADRYIWSYYPGYMCVLHEVLSGFRIFPKDPPYGECASRVLSQCLNLSGYVPTASRATVCLVCFNIFI
ncbi:uncharacterized protein LOC121049314 [Rosa chinensis]|uniref:uncharacterized protein LOC121049314 n=1 Tax=Rosa chinensis TaxID=74649 RepID=UPI001AD94ADA|nr:uncharacterized protein LOC121049314 [Rosa chinensis]